MALTITVVKRLAARNHRSVIADITGDSSYPTGGEAITAAQVAALLGEPPVATASLVPFILCTSERSTGGYTIALDRTNTKVMFWAASAEATNAGDLSAVVVRVRLDFNFPTG